jgi:hypothetical protein
VNTIVVDISGASGGIQSGGTPGNGGRVRATLPVIPGSCLYIYIGGAGGCPDRGWNGGGSGGVCSSCYSTGGGGATDIRIGGTTLANRVVVAAGGGGYYAGGACGVQFGGHGGFTGGNGSLASTECVAAPVAATGGTQTGGGTGGFNPGTLGHGENAGDCVSGGGGGGYYGGKHICAIILNVCVTEIFLFVLFR